MSPLERLAKASFDAREGFLNPHMRADWAKSPQFHRDMELERMRAVLGELARIRPELQAICEELAR